MGPATGPAGRAADRAVTEGGTVSGGMRALEAEEPGRHLVGFDHRIKTKEAIEARVVEAMWAKGRTVEEVFADLTDGIRYTFEYPDQTYAHGLRRDLKRLAVMGFTEVELRNAWSWEQYKGITSCWLEPVSGHLFEVQFHTRHSYHAWQLTNPVYLLLRHPHTPDAERAEIKAFIRSVFASVPIPPRATEIEDHPRKTRDENND
jgi:hypothetical protein